MTSDREDGHLSTPRRAEAPPAEPPTPDGLARVTLDPQDGPEAFDHWQETTRSVFQVEPIGDPTSFRFWSDFFYVNGVIVDHVRFSAASYRRDARHIKSSDEDFISLHLPIRGVERGQVNDNPHAMTPGQITLQDWAHPYATVTEPIEKFGIVIPRRLIAKSDRLYEQRPVIAWPLDTPAGRMFEAAWMQLWWGLPVARSDEAPRLASGFLGLLNGLIDAELNAGPVVESHTSLLHAMKRYLNDRLNDPNLGLDDLTETFGCSRSTVYRLFEKDNGVQSFIRQQRLQRCLDAILSGMVSNQQIALIAQKWGFRTSTQFHRAFKSRFGLTPSELAQARQTIADEDGQSDPKTASALDEKVSQLKRWVSLSVGNE